MAPQHVDRSMSAWQVPDRAGSVLDVTVQLINGDMRSVDATWPTPSVIISNGAYGVGGFPGDPRSPDQLPAWYADHLRAWTEAATVCQVDLIQGDRVRTSDAPERRLHE